MVSAANLSRIIIKLTGESYLSTGKTFHSTGALLFQLDKKLSRHFPGAKISRLFWSVHPKKITGLIEQAVHYDKKYLPPDFFSYYAIDYPDEDVSALMEWLRDDAEIELAYVEVGHLYPPFEPTEKSEQAFYQYCLQPAPEGIDAHYAWSQKGGDGRGRVKFIDIEQGWILHHEAYRIKQLPNTGLNADFFKDHGAAVLGTIMMYSGDDAPKGIVPHAKGYIISQWRPDMSFNTADAIMLAVSKLAFGDILLLETQIVDEPGSEKLWPIEIQEANFQAIRLATALGITVIEAAGNGGTKFSAGNDLDNFKDHFGRFVLKPDDHSFKDSGAILVAAGSACYPHEKILFSNFGKRIDSYAHGQLVYTAGFLPASSGESHNLYTWGFGGTSAAAAIITGAAISIQSFAEANYHSRLSPGQMRQILRNVNLTTPSAKGRLIDKIGGMPDLRKIIGYLEQFSTELFSKAPHRQHSK